MKIIEVDFLEIFWIESNISPRDPEVVAAIQKVIQLCRMINYDPEYSNLGTGCPEKSLSVVLRKVMNIIPVQKPKQKIEI